MTFYKSQKPRTCNSLSESGEKKQLFQEPQGDTEIWSPTNKGHGARPHSFLTD